MGKFYSEASSTLAARADGLRHATVVNPTEEVTTIWQELSRVNPDGSVKLIGPHPAQLKTLAEKIAKHARHVGFFAAIKRGDKEVLDKGNFNLGSSLLSFDVSMFRLPPRLLNTIADTLGVEETAKLLECYYELKQICEKSLSDYYALAAVPEKIESIESIEKPGADYEKLLAEQNLRVVLVGNGGDYDFYDLDRVGEDERRVDGAAINHNDYTNTRREAAKRFYEQFIDGEYDVELGKTNETKKEE